MDWISQNQAEQVQGQNQISSPQEVQNVQVQSASQEWQIVLENGMNINPEQYLHYLLSVMVQYECSDMYLTYNEPPTLRISWEACRLTKLPKLEDSTLEAIANVLMTEEDQEFFKENYSSDIGYTAHGRRYRVNVSRQRDHKMIVCRLLDEKVPTIDGKWLPKIFKSLTDQTSWIVFVAWSTGAWKSTTLAAMIEEINNKRACHVITIEDPIEYIFEPKKCIFEQKQLWKDVISFASAMKFALRQRPDVILFGEARDPESLRHAIALAETWHLVLTTIHSRSAEQTINKIISMFPVDEQPVVQNQLAENLTAIIEQRLLKKVDGTWMIPAHEILLNNTAVSNLIRENKTNQIRNTIYSNRSSGMQLLEDDLARLVIEWKVSFEDALYNANDPEEFRRAVEDKASWY